MKTSSIECKNCGATLQVSGADKFLECRFCKAAHRVEWVDEGEPQLTMLEAAVREIGTGVKAVDKTTSKILDIHKSMAAKEDAKGKLQELKQQYQRTIVEIENRESQLIKQHKNSRSQLYCQAKEDREENDITTTLAKLISLFLFMSCGCGCFTAAIEGGLWWIGAGVLITVLGTVAIIKSSIDYYSTAGKELHKFESRAKQETDELAKERHEVESRFGKESDLLQSIVDTAIDYEI